MSDPRSIRRHEDPPLLTGTSRFVADFNFPGQLSMVVVRSPTAHGRIIGIDITTAAAIDGVTAVWTGADLASALGAVPRIPPRVSFDETVVPYLQPVLAVDRVRYVGEPVAVVVAADQYLAEDAASQVIVDTEPLGAVVDPRQAGEGPVLFAEGNEITTLEASFGNAAFAFENAPVVVDAVLSVGRHTGVPMETRGIAVDYDDGRCLVYGATKVPHWNRSTIADLLGIDPAQIVMRESAVGGGFGVRGELYPEDVLAVWAAYQLRRPVKWIEDRREHLIAANHSREQHHFATIAGDDEGHIVAIRSHFWVDLGAYVRTHGIRVPDLTLSMLPGPYDITHYEGKAHCMMTNRTPTATYRAPGRFESCFVRERLIDLYADRVHMDPAEVRRRNLLPKERLPYERPLRSTGEPMIFSDADYIKLFDRVVAAIDWQELAERRRNGERVGAGVAMFLEKSGLGPWETGSVKVDEDGQISVRSGGSSVGQGYRTVIAQLVAEALEVQPGTVRVELLDTDETSRGIGSYASRTTVTAGSAVWLSAGAVKDEALDRAGHYLEANRDDLEYRAGGVQVKGDPQTRLTLGELARMGPVDESTSRSDDPDRGLYAERVFDVERVVYPYGAHGAVVRIDGETGNVTVEELILGYDVGRAVNPALVAGQLHGGAVQALGGSLLETFQYDELGNPLVTSFMDYLLPTLGETPSILTFVTEDSPTSTNPLGVKGSGEGGVPGVAPAIAAAIDQALGLSGAVSRLPVDPQAILALINQAQGDSEASSG